MYRHLSIDIDGDEKMSSDGTVQEISKASVEKSLGHFFQPEVREIKCEKCTDGTHAQQTLRILSRYVFASPEKGSSESSWNLCLSLVSPFFFGRPKVLLLHLKRFIVVERPISPVAKGDENHPPNTPPKPVQVEYIFKKNKAQVMIPPSLSLEAFRTVEQTDDEELARSSDAAVSTIDQSSTKDYSLQSIVHHIGSRASSGHYTADAVRQIDQSQESVASTEPVWVTFDDSNTSLTSLKRIVENQFKQGTAYMLLYTLDDDQMPRKDPPILTLQKETL